MHAVLNEVLYNLFKNLLHCLLIIRMLSPNRTKFRKHHRGRMSGKVFL